MTYKRIEHVIVASICILAAVDLILIAQSSMQLDLPGYVPGISFAAFLFLLGQFYRFRRGDERLGSTLVGAGAFIAFTIIASIFNYLLLPLKFPRIDEQLMALDASFGYSWACIVEWAAQHPFLSLALRYVYSSSLPQLIIVVLVLGFTGRLIALWEFLGIGMLSVMICIALWFFLPSFGPTTLIELDPAKTETLALGRDYATAVLHLSLEGESFLTPKNTLGLIAFPSFHTVMAAMVVVFAWKISWLRWPAVVINAAMVPAILIHGSHYAVDVFGGVIVFLITAWIITAFKNYNSDS